MVQNVCKQDQIIYKLGVNHVLTQNALLNQHRDNLPLEWKKKSKIEDDPENPKYHSLRTTALAQIKATTTGTTRTDKNDHFKWLAILSHSRVDHGLRRLFEVGFPSSTCTIV